MNPKSLKETFVSVKFCVVFCLAIHQALSQDENGVSPRSRSCKSVFHKPATCKSLEDCQSLLNLIKKHPFIGRRVVESSICSIDGFDVTVCCPQIEKTNNNSTDDKQSKGKPTQTIPVSSYKPLKPPQCGYSNAVHNRVVGGNPAVLDAWPWIALLGYGPSSNYVDFKCGGTLISSRHVVTAAHCILDDLKVVRLGELDLDSTTDGANPIDVLVERATVHPQFNEVTLENDIAILKLNKDVQFTDAIHPICLPLANDIKNRNYVGTFPFVAGWGATYYTGSGSNILREAQVPVINNARCESSYRYVEDIVINNKVMCAGYAQGGKDACQGDSGGPLMSPKKSTYYLIGIVSGGYKCAEPGYPGVYTRVTSFLDFIQSNMN